MHKANMEPIHQNKPVYLNQTLIHFKIKSSATSSCFQPCFKTESANIPQKNRITLEKMTTPNSQEKNTPDFLEEYGTWYYGKIHFLRENAIFTKPVACKIGK